MGTVNMRIGKTDYSADVVIGKSETRLYLYDIINLKEITIKERRSNQQRYSQKEKMLNIVTSSNNSILQDSKNDNKMFLLRDNYKQDIDTWYKRTTKEQHLKDGGNFHIRTTSEALKSIGIEDYNIYFGKSKVQKILDKHPDMIIELIKRVPEILEHPVIVMDSITREDGLVILGELYTSKGVPLMATLLIDPKTGKGDVEDFAPIIEENERLRKQNELLEQQFKVTKGHKPKVEDVTQMCRKILKKYHSDYNLDDMVNNFKNIIDITSKSKFSNNELYTFFWKKL